MCFQGPLFPSPCVSPMFLELPALHYTQTSFCSFPHSALGMGSSGKTLGRTVEPAGLMPSLLPCGHQPSINSFMPRVVSRAYVLSATFLSTGIEETNVSEIDKDLLF